jgi:AcrR family transcriptional regulator
MARRSDHTREELKELAVSAGQKIIREEGFANFSARKVARNIGYTIGTIYNIFENHDDFILNINIVTLHDLGNFIESNTSETGEKGIKQMADAYVEFAQKDYNRWSALFEHMMPKGDELPKWYDDEIRKIFLAVEQQFLDIITDKEEAKMAARTIWAGIHGICQLGLTGKLDIVDAKPINELTDSLIHNYLQSIKSC